jgi:hypothetical protein
MSRNRSQKLRELNHFREQGDGGGGEFRAGHKECLFARQSRNARNGEFSHTAFAVYLDQAGGRKVFRLYRLSSKLDPRQVMCSINWWTVGAKERDLCAANSVRRSIEQTKRCRHA